MKTIELEVPEPLAREIDRLVERGWFATEAEVARRALTEFLLHHKLDLEERFQRDDIA